LFNKSIPEKRLILWTVMAVAAPILSLSGRNSWIGVLLLSVACGGLSYAMLRLWNREYNLPCWLCVIEWLWIGTVLGSIGGNSGSCWEEENARTIVPMVLLFLAAFSAQHGSEKASRAGAVSFWIVVVILVSVLLAGIKNLRMEWLIPVAKSPEPVLISVCLIPCLLIFLPGSGQGKYGAMVIMLGALAVISALWVNGSITGEVAQTVENPFYIYCKNISILGTAERFEALASCGLTIGWYSLFSLLLSVAGCLADRVNGNVGKIGVWGSAVVGAVMAATNVSVPGMLLASGSVMLWVVVPGLVTCNKKVKKSEKST